MIAKNVSSQVLEFPSLGLTLYPGDQIELAKFAQQQRDQCSELQIAFTKGELILIGPTKAPITDHNDFLREARVRLIGYDDRKSIPVPAFPGVEPPKPSIKSTLKRENSEATNEPNRYDREKKPPSLVDSEFAQYRTPLREIVQHLNEQEQQKEDFEDGDPAVYVDSKADAEDSEIISLSEEKGAESIPGVIDSTPWLSNKTKKNLGLLKTVTAKEMNSQKLEQFRKQQCIALRKNSRRCKIKALPGYLYCFRHLDEAGKKKYLAAKKSK